MADSPGRRTVLAQALNALDVVATEEARREVLVNFMADIELIVEDERTTDPPAPDLDEPIGRATARVAGGVQAFLTRHYTGEMRERGFRFLIGVFAELLAMAYASSLVHQAEVDPEAVPRNPAELVIADFFPRIKFYQEQASGNRSRELTARATARRTPQQLM